MLCCLHHNGKGKGVPMKRFYILTILILYSSSIVRPVVSIDGNAQPSAFEVLFQESIDDAEEQNETRSWFETLSFIGLMICSCDILFRAIWNLNQQRKGVYELTPERIQSLLDVLTCQRNLATSLAKVDAAVNALNERLTALEQARKQAPNLSKGDAGDAANLV